MSQSNRRGKENRTDFRQRYFSALQWKGALESVAIIFLVLYPLRNIHVGGDLMDTGYNYVNFLYMGTKHVDSMWVFSTYLATLVGHLMTLLPGGETILGLNLYTSLIVSLIAVISYRFCTVHLKISHVITFLGIFFALNLCWCPTALLYNYLTYLLLLIACRNLYVGMERNRNSLLLVAGICIGLNVFVRFSNLPELSLLAIIWLYGVAVHLDGGKDALLKTLARTLWFLMGYVGIVAACLVALGIVYGRTAYFSGISELLAMTESASDYTAFSMIRTMFREYWDAGYWLSRIAFFAIAGVLIAVPAKLLDWRFMPETSRKGKIWPFKEGFSLAALSKLIGLLLGVFSVIWLFSGEPERHFASALYYSYDSVSLPARVLLLLFLLFSLLRMVIPWSTPGERLISALCVFLLLITPLGSNNGLYSAMNNLFLVAPFGLWQIYIFIRRRETGISDIRMGGGKGRIPVFVRRFVRLIPLFSAKAVLCAFLLLCTVQFTAFGNTFVFTESTGVIDPVYEIEGVKVFSGIRMSEKRAEGLADAINYVNQNNLKGRDVILYGNNPSLSLYLGMPPAFNSWPSLRSYSYQKFALAMSELSGYPVIILDAQYEGFLEDPSTYAEENMFQEGKWALLQDFMRVCGYRPTFRSDEFTLYEPGGSR
ncbi:MAG: hypothetical protein K5891_01390 [Lachnospiraceae bacterium]|nr:hypothetical protein [Lachnospiraceae bacterium]